MPEGRKIISTEGILSHIKNDMELWIQARSVIVAAAECVEDMRQAYPGGLVHDGVIKLEAALVAAGVLKEHHYIGDEEENDVATRPTDPGTPSAK